ncbi:MAG TPA: 4-hydroxy-tetrahydrodipicolinate synthase [Hyphomicrobiaceae bacterium]|nr:4-hydroxy-tetrahydrodipicolinate synthase [Hyphomicrobiaceae bacterium]
MLTGVWIPLVTPFKDGRLDLASYKRLIEHYVARGASALFALGTTGEAPTLDDDEVDEIVATTVEVAAGRLPVFVGIGGNDTRKVIKTLRQLQRFAFTGLVSVCPYYSRPSQDGMRQHFSAIADATDRQILIYNIPYRTCVNLANDTLLRLAERTNIVGVKDSSGSIAQSLELLASKPPGFSVLTGEDGLYFTMLCNGADGGILAAAHLATERFVEIGRLIAANDMVAARATWRSLSRCIPKLFQEANPMPIKHCLWRQGLIASPECRLPLSSISDQLAHALDGWLATQRAA